MVETLLVRIKAIDQFSGTFTRLQGQAAASGGAVGRFGTAAKVAAVVGVAVLAKGLHSVVKAAMDGQAVMAETESIIKSTGGVANVTGEHIQKLSLKIRDYSGYDDELVQSGANMMLTFRKVRNEAGKGNDVFDRSIHTLADMSRKFGIDMPTAAKQLGKALEDPIQGVTALRRMGVQLDDQQQASIKTFMEQGDIVSAQKIILGELETQIGGVAEAYGSTLAGKLEILNSKFEEMKGEIGEALLPVLMDLADKGIAMMDKLQGPIKKVADEFGNLAGQVLQAGMDTGAVEGMVSGMADTLSTLADVLNFLNRNGIAEFIVRMAQIADGARKLALPLFDLIGFITTIKQMMGQEVKKSFDTGREAFAQFYRDADAEASKGKEMLPAKIQETMIGMARQIVSNTPAAQGNMQALMTELTSVVRSKGLDLRNATGEQILGMAQDISAKTGIPVEAVQGILNQMTGRVSSTKLQTSPIHVNGPGNLEQVLANIRARVQANPISVFLKAAEAGYSRHGGGEIRHSGGYAHGGMAMTDERDVRVQTGEFVIQRKAVQNLGVRTLNRLNRGESGGGTVVNFNSTFSMASDSEMRRAAQKLNKYLAAEGAR